MYYLLLLKSIIVIYPLFSHRNTSLVAYFETRWRSVLCRTNRTIHVLFMDFDVKIEFTLTNINLFIENEIIY